jgi:uncharacterized protein YdeI (YjbR/CyaY-like superfamily)
VVELTSLDRPIAAFASQSAWEEWLEANHTSSDGIWMKLAKKASGVPSVTYPEAVESALCFGWIDGQKKPFDAEWWLQKFTPRRRGSPWSRINRDKAEELIRDGRMRSTGHAAIELAKANGRWAAAYQSAVSATVPPDLQLALDNSPVAAAAFAQLSRANRYAILYRIQDAKRPETRQKRLDHYVAMLERGDRPHP